MDSRERFLCAISHETPDRVPRDFWSTAETDAKLCRALGLRRREDLLNRFDADLRYIEGPRYVGPPLARHADGAEDDLWGVPRVTLFAGEGDRRQSYQEVVRPPLGQATRVEEIESYGRWPNPDQYDYSVVADQARRVRDAGRVACFMGDRLNRIAQLKPAMYLRGVDQALLDMALNPDLLRAVIARVRAFYETYLRRILESADGWIDLLVTGDDFGSQGGMLCSPAAWREFLAPGFRSFLAIAAGHGVPVMHHTCGSVRPIIGDMIRAGLAVLNPVQPGARDMDPAQLKAEFGRRLCFHGGVSIQTNLPFGCAPPITSRRTRRSRTCWRLSRHTTSSGAAAEAVPQPKTTRTRVTRGVHPPLTAPRARRY
jgi:uroporphyrinogen decarboxylase